MGISNYVIYPPLPCDDGMNANGAQAKSLRFARKVIYGKNNPFVLESNQQAIDISSLKPGLYLIKSKMENGEILTKKIIL